MDGKRPVNLNLLSMRFPVTAIMSIGHRITGVLLFLMLPMLLWILSAVLSGDTAYASLQHCLASPAMRVVSWVFLVCVGYHVLAGIRHLLMDAHVLPHSFCVGKATAWLILLLSVVWAVFVGVWLW